MSAVVQVLANGPLPIITTLPVDEALGRLRVPPPAPASAGTDELAVEDIVIPTRGSSIPGRLYRPVGAARPPLLVHLHGGGWVTGSIAGDDARCRTLAVMANCAILSVGYRLAPEHRFPKGLEDCYDATAWAVAQAGHLGVDATRVGVGGTSAGANLAAGVALLARDRAEIRIAFQLLAYPICDGKMALPSYDTFSDGYILTRDAMKWYWGLYLSSETDRSNGYASPLDAVDLRGLPPALILTAEFDPLRDEGEAYGARLRDAGVQVEVIRYPGVIHGFMSFAPQLAQSRMAMATSAEALKTFGLTGVSDPTRGRALPGG